MRIVICCMLALFASDVLGEEYTYGAIAAKRLEQQFDNDSLLFDLEAYYGNDYHRAVIKLEGDKEDGADPHYDLELLYGKPISAFFDLQFGLAILEEGDATTTGLTVGIEGEAPYRIHVEAFATITEDGDTLLSLETDRSFLLTDRWSFVPRIELAAALSDVDETGAGFSKVEVETRMHYIYSQRFMPYLGLSWQRDLGDSGRQLHLAGEDDSVTTALLGVSFWFR